MSFFVKKLNIQCHQKRKEKHENQKGRDNNNHHNNNQKEERQKLFKNKINLQINFVNLIILYQKLRKVIEM